jgi:hypothetical protein
MICDKCGKKVDTGRLIKGIGFLCNMCLSWLNVKIKKRKEDNFIPDWNAKPEFLKDLLMLLEGT